MGILPLFALLLALANPLAGEVHTPHVLVRYSNESARIGLHIGTYCEQWRAEAAKLSGIVFPEKITVLVPYSRDEFEQVQPNGEMVPLWAQAVAYPQYLLIIIKGSGIRSMEEVRQLFLHEYTHVMLGSIFSHRPIPEWLHEGLAMNLAGEWDISRWIIMSQAVMADRIIPLTQLEKGFPLDESLARLAYAESHYVLSFFVDSFGAEALGRFIRDYGRGFGFDQALYRATGLKPEKFEEKWERFIRFRFSWLPLITSAGTFWFIVSVAFILAYIRKKRKTRLILQEWEQEEEESAGGRARRSLNDDRD